MKTRIVSLPISLLLLSLVSNVAVQTVDNLPFNTSLDGGVTVSFTTAPSDTRSDLKLTPNVSNDFSGDGVALRIKNNITTGGGSPMFIYLNESESNSYGWWHILPLFHNRRKDKCYLS